MKQKSNRPPLLTRWILARLNQYETDFSITGDLSEEFKEIVSWRGRLSAVFWYWGQVIYSVVTYLKISVLSGGIMFKNYMKIAMRNIFRNKLYSFLNIAGLSIGIACCLLILFYVQDDLSFDRFHKNADRIYRVNPTLSTSERTVYAATAAHAQGPMLKAEYPEIETYIRFSSYGPKKIIKFEEKVFFEERFLWCDANLFEVFSFKLKSGNPREALVTPYLVVITADMAAKYFGNEDPLGKSLLLNNEDLYKVTGVMENIPKTSHFRPDFFASISTLNLKPSGNAIRDLLSQINYFTFLVLREGTDPKAMELKFDGFLEKHLGAAMKSLGGTARLELQPLTRIYLHSDRDNEMERTSDIAYVYLFSGIGVFILLLACLNFMNLSTARSANRAKEVGLRKVVGARKPQLVRQFLGESFVLTFISVAIGLLLVFLFMPLFRSISGKDLTAGFLSHPVLWAGLLALLAVVSLIGGSYPAFFLSAFRPVETLQGKLRKGAKSSALRIVLVSLQFTVSIVLIIGTLIVSKQLNYIQNKNLGYDKEHVLTVNIRNPETQKKHKAIKNTFIQHPDVQKVSASATSPLGHNDFRAEHAVGKPANESFMLFAQFVDEDFIDLYDIKILAGRNFSSRYPTDVKNSIIINEATVKKLGWQDNPINQEIEVGLTTLGKKKRYKVVGVAEDYHFQSLHENISPLVIFNSCLYGQFNQISARVRPENIRETLEFLESKWNEFDTKFRFEFSFVDDQFDELYRTEERLGQLFGYFTILAILIGCLGLFGLTSFASEQRTKEIGIRKVLGASVSSIVMLLVREFTKWVVAAVLIAWPIGYFVMKSWLQNFAFRIGLGVDIFLAAALLALLIAVLTVGYQSIRAALTNPADAIKYE